jgi:hypothetical protein
MKKKYPIENKSSLAGTLGGDVPGGAAWRSRLGQGMAAMVLGAAIFANAQSTEDASAPDYDTFRIIAERNIFNPDRYPQYHYQQQQVTPAFSLAGTMSYRKGLFAFFNGTSEQYQKALQSGGTIAGYTVAKITFEGVQLQSGGKSIEMEVGSAMRQEGDGWELTAPGNWGAETESASPDEAAATNLPASLPSSGEQNDVLKRLMEERQQELKTQ